ncbi:hypothetical protein MMC25_007723 [Agyrium rufum]|nr:hypothetical protein [Agyrium rufum]
MPDIISLLDSDDEAGHTHAASNDNKKPGLLSELLSDEICPDYDASDQPSSKRRRLSPPFTTQLPEPSVGSKTIAPLRQNSSNKVSRYRKRTLSVFSFSSEIEVSSSPKQPPHETIRGRPASLLHNPDLFSDPVFGDDEGHIKNGRSMTTELSERTKQILAALSTNKPAKRQASKGKAKEPEPIRSQSHHQSRSNSPEEPAKRKSASRKPTLTEDERRDKELTRMNAKAAKEQAKEMEKEQKRITREKAQAEKKVLAELTEVNKLRTDKKISTPEMIVDFPMQLHDTPLEAGLKECLNLLQVQFGYYNSSIPGIVKWRRKMTAKYNEALDYWEPKPVTVEDEKHVACIIQSRELVELTIEKAAGLDDLFVQIKTCFAGCQIILLIEGLESLLKKWKNSANRAYQAGVRNGSQSQNAANSGASGSRKKKPDGQLHIDEEAVEMALIKLQTAQKCYVHHTSSTADTAQWIANYTQHISTVPYRRQRQKYDASFCMEAGQVKCGDGKQDTFVKMLQENIRVTAPVAYGIAHEYPNVVKLLRGMKKEGPLLLENLQKTANRDGTLTDARIGPALSKRLYKVFMGLDPASTDI